MVVLNTLSTLYTLKKSKKIFRSMVRLFQKKSKKLDPSVKEKVLTHLTHLQQAILQKDPKMASRMATTLEEKSKVWMPKTRFDSFREHFISMLLALLIAIGVRGMWFDNYSIPSGSMRPTLKEGDFLFVSKSAYGVNVPLKPAHFYFDPSLIKRGDVFTFSGRNMDIPDVDTLYFYLFPGKKQFVKRLIAKPGDTLYFYGGKIYGINASGKDLTELREASWMHSLEHIPFIRFEGKVRRGDSNTFVFYQMNQPVAKLTSSYLGKPLSQLLPVLGKKAEKHYSDLWGMKNYAMAKILSKQEAQKYHPTLLEENPDASWYLELLHHPSLHQAEFLRDSSGNIHPQLHLSTSILPLSETHLKRIQENLVTCRFTVQDGVAFRQGVDPNTPHIQNHLPRLPFIPDGTYEFSDGKAYQIGFANLSKELPEEHPLYQLEPQTLQLLFNLGVEFFNHYTPSKHTLYLPSRYAYFANQELYLMGKPVFKKEDPALIVFLQKEYQKQASAPEKMPYRAFDDPGPPLLPDGKIDTAFIKQHGITIPPESYLALGDNHAMSADSRQFGFVPEDNIRGKPSLIFWPVGDRLGSLPQPSHSLLTLPHIFVGTLIILGLIAYLFYLRSLLYISLEKENKKSRF